MIADTDIAARANNKVAAEIGDEAVILDIESGFYFQLNTTAARIWALLEAPMTVAALCAKVEGAFEVDSATCRAEVVEFLELMQSKALATVEAA